MTLLTSGEWNQFLKDFPHSHLLQTTNWGNLKAAFGWSVHRLTSGSCGAQILFRTLPAGFTFGYIPKGPLGEVWSSIWVELDQLCRNKRAIFLKVEPDFWEPFSDGFRERNLAGFIPGRQDIQPRRSILVDLRSGEESILERMKQKTRYNIHLAQRKDIKVGSSSDLNAFYQLMLVTGKRDGFGVHSYDYYQKAYELFAPSGNCQLFLGTYQAQPVAGLMVFAKGSRAWYFYGASNDQERNRMPAYLLQWEAMRWAVGRGCQEYDLWGVPDLDEATLESEFSHKSDDLWGVYRFKRGFGGALKRTVGSWDRVYQPWLYRLYLWWIGRRARGVTSA